MRKRKEAAQVLWQVAVARQEGAVVRLRRTPPPPGKEVVCGARGQRAGREAEGERGAMGPGAMGVEMRMQGAVTSGALSGRAQGRSSCGSAQHERLRHTAPAGSAQGGLPAVTH